MSEVAKREGNYVPVGLAEDDDGNPKMLRIDSVTGRLLVEVTDNNAASPTIIHNAPRDDNRVPVGMGVDDDGEPTPIYIDADTGSLLCDLA